MHIFRTTKNPVGAGLLAKGPDQPTHRPGVATDLDVAEAAAQVAAIESRLPALEQRQSQLINALSLLMGEPPKVPHTVMTGRTIQRSENFVLFETSHFYPMTPIRLTSTHAVIDSAHPSGSYGYAACLFVGYWIDLCNVRSTGANVCAR
ncbi:MULTISPECIES: hypothetical protein [unclassified Pseudomonas]|jgi:hypothetical protein|uniref:hypothetical protein n=1 Tax=unclassified Pseudomonas TaxID=196821 RepID=UPI000DADA109|nr:MULTISPECIES: hypothetical protein [unclassified Pseudomonas]MBV7511897.1 hypothetical protein [Pseudomonas sp. PDM25]